MAEERPYKEDEGKRLEGKGVTLDIADLEEAFGVVVIRS
jgi:hypothetical protein